MPDDQRYLQLRLATAMRKEIGNISQRLGMSASDVIRGALIFGLPILVSLEDLKTQLDRRLMRILKRQARAKRSRKVR